MPTTNTPSEQNTSLLDLLEDPQGLNDQLLRDSCLCLEALRAEVTENGFLNTAKTQAMVSMTKLVLKLMEEKAKAPRDNNLMASLVSALPFDDGTDEIVIPNTAVKRTLLDDCVLTQ